MIPLISNPNVDNSDLVNYPDGRIKDNTGSGNGTPVNRNVYGDLHANISKLMRKYGIIPNGLPDNEFNNYQIIDAVQALASKNDYIYALATDGTTLSIDIKLSFMNVNEFLICRASADKTTETTIKGIGAETFAVTYSGNFKANEYVRVIKTALGVSIIRVADFNSLNAMATDFLFLKKATQAEEDAGTIDTVATTPKVNKVAFAKRVNGSDSPAYLASALQNGLLSKEQWAIINTVGSNPVKNVGWFSGLDPGGMSVGANLPVSGNIVSAIVISSASNVCVLTVTFANAMVALNYKVRTELESEGTLALDREMYREVWKKINNTSFSFSIREAAVGVQNIKVHIEVVQL